MYDASGLVLCLWVGATLGLTVQVGVDSAQNIAPTTDGILVKEDICAVKTPGPFAIPWLETRRPARGCSVSYQGLQGHGQHPEEVHVIRLTDKGTSTQPTIVKVWLDAASCPKPQVAHNSSHVRHPRPFKELWQDSLNDGFDHTISNITPLPLQEQDADVVEPPSSMVALLGPGKAQSVGLKERPLVVVLASAQPVNWQLKLGDCWSKHLASNIQVVANKVSTVEAEFPFQLSYETWSNNVDRKSIQRFIRRTYHGVASSTNIQGANSIRIRVGPGGPADKETDRRRAGRNRNKPNFCDFRSRQDSLTVSASLVVHFKADGCIYGEQHDTSVPNIFVVDLEAQPVPDSKVSKKGKLQTSSLDFKNDLKNFPSFVVLLQGKSKYLKSEVGSDFVSDFESNNITVILRSSQPVRWLLKANQLHSSVVIVSNVESVVENGGVGANVGLEVLSRQFPHKRAEFFSMIVAEFGAPVVYTRVKQATGLTLIVEDVSESNLNTSSIPSSASIAVPSLERSVHSQSEIRTEQKPRPPHFLLPPNRHKIQPVILPINPDHGGRQLMNKLELSMTIVCEKSRLEVVFPMSVLGELGIHSLHLNDRSCLAEMNHTHASLTSLITSCGSTSHTDGKSTAFSNYVHVNFDPPNTDDEDSEGSGNIAKVDETENDFRVPVVCRYEPLLSGSDIFDEEGDDMDGMESSVNTGEIETSGNGMHLRSESGLSALYQLEIYRDQLLTNSLRLNSRPAIAGIEAELNETFYVRAWMDGAASVRVMAESCWISNRSQAEDGGQRDRVILIRGFCPVHKSVKLGHQLMFPGTAPNSAAATFSFQVNEDYSRLGQKLFIHCRVGVCASSQKHSRGNLVLCIVPQRYCSDHGPRTSVSKTVSAAQQLLTRGPILLMNEQQFTPLIKPPVVPKCAEMAVFSSENIGPVITTEMVVAIAVCSFIIGVGLTAALWCIHSKTDPQQHRLPAGENSLGSRSSRSAVTSSSLSPHSHSGCSSTNSQSAIAS